MHATARMQVPSKASAAPKYKKAPDAPKRFKSAFIIFSAEKHKEIKEDLLKQGRSEKTTDIAKLVSESWRELNPEQKEVWEKKARKDKARYEVEKAMYKGPWKVPANKRTPKDPSAPKRPMSAFLAFSNKRRAALKRQHPDATNADLSKMLSKTWKEAPDELRRKYMDEEAELRETYKVEMAKWRKKVAEEKKAERKEREDIAMATAENRANEAARTSSGASLDTTGMPQQDVSLYGNNYGYQQNVGGEWQGGGPPGQGGSSGQYPGMQNGYVNPQQQQILQQILAGQQRGIMGGPMNGYGLPQGGQFQQGGPGMGGQFGPGHLAHGMGSAGGNFGMDAPQGNDRAAMEGHGIKEEGDQQHSGDSGENEASADMGYDQHQNFAPPNYGGRSGQESSHDDYDRSAAI